jgi:hypothetical protein
MRALAGVVCDCHPKFIEALRAAETDEAAPAEALRVLNEVPALNRRRLMGSYLAVAKRLLPQTQLATDRRGQMLDQQLIDRARCESRTRSPASVCS